MNFRKVTVDQDLYQTVCAHLLSFAAHCEGKKPDRNFPKLESIGLALHMILSGFKNTGKYSAKDLAQELRDIANGLDAKEGPKHGTVQAGN